MLIGQMPSNDNATQIAHQAMPLSKVYFIRTGSAR
jgi:hypothetical protein